MLVNAEGYQCGMETVSGKIVLKSTGFLQIKIDPKALPKHCSFSVLTTIATISEICLQNEFNMIK